MKNEIKPISAGPVPFSIDDENLLESGSGRGRLHLAKIGRIRAKLNILEGGFSERLHMHSSIDGFWLVKSGTVRFFGENEELIGVFSEGEGVVVPRGSWYGFKAGPDGAELLQVLALGDDDNWDRKNFEEQ